MEAVVRRSLSKKDTGIEEIERPTVGQGDVLLRVRKAGVCGSDVGAYLGKPEYEYMPVPSVLGHEFTGTVIETGEGVSSFQHGDRVVLQPGRPCGECYQCLTGASNNCPEKPPGVAEGGFGVFTTAPADRVLRIPEDVSFTEAAVTEPLAVTHRAVVTNGAVAPGDTVLVEGPGPMGVFSALLARLAGGSVLLTGLERDESRLSVARRLGFDTKIVDSMTDPVELIPDSNRNGFDVCIDATGVPAGLETALGVTRPGGTVVVVGILSEEISCDWSEVIRGEITIAPSHGSVTSDFLRVLDIINEGHLPFGEIIDTDYDITNPEDAFDAFADAKTIKPMFDLSALAD